MSLRLVALGGVGEFGANSLWVEGDGGDGLLVDAGAAFSDEPSLGLAYEIPDYCAISPRPPAAIVLTHAHDDHVKGVATALDAWPDVPVAASRATINWVRSGWENGRAPGMHELAAGAPFSAGAFVIEAAPLSHSISGTLALRIRSDDATLVVATDWRLQPSALGEETATAILDRWGDEGVDLALIDSTNALVVTPPPTEDVVAATLVDLVRAATGAVVAVSFASHAGRFRQLVLAAVEAGRQVVVAGRGLVEMLQIHQHLGLIQLPLGIVRPLSDLPRLDRDRVVLVATGSQGEGGSAFSRLAAGLLPGFRLQTGDVVLHAARVIPGNERRLAGMFDECVRRGASVVTAAEAPIHASGHPPIGEVEAMLERLRPRHVLPIHGRRRNLQAVAQRAAKLGFASVVAENGDELALAGTRFELTGEVRSVGRIVFDDIDETAVDAATIHQRRSAARDGVVVVTAARVATREKFVVQLATHGITLDAAFERRAVVTLAAELRALGALTAHDPDAVRSTMSRWLRRELRRHTGRRPGVLALVVAP